jgi:hypothetical protein
MAFDLSAEWRPSYGSMRHSFDFDPLHYGVGGARQSAFKERIRDELSQYGFLLTGEVGITWELFVDEQDRWESDSGADVDNFAKLLNDALIGTRGIIIDDVQVQRLEVAWLPTLGASSFDLMVRCSQDEWTTRPASLYELSDRRWYPISDTTAQTTPEGTAILLHALDDSVRLVRQVRSRLRELGADRRQAFGATMMLAPNARGFHSTRATSADFIKLRRTEWRDIYPRPSTMEAPLGDADYQGMADALWASR